MRRQVCLYSPFLFSPTVVSKHFTQHTHARLCKAEHQDEEEEKMFLTVKCAVMWFDVCKEVCQQLRCCYKWTFETFEERCRPSDEQKNSQQPD